MGGERKLDGGKEVPIMSHHYVANTPVLDRMASRPVVVVDDLARMRGPSKGVVTLPITLDWTPRTRYDLSNETAQRSLYQVVLREARTEAELEEYLNADLLCRLWNSLTLPRPVREIWEAQHPALAA
jgi:hypothetical protein